MMLILLVRFLVGLLAAPDFLDPPPRRSRGDFIGRANPPVLCDPSVAYIIQFMLRRNIIIAMHKNTLMRPQVGLKHEAASG